MSWQLVHLEDVLASPWKNGGGTTRELVTWPQTNDWLWRMSVAEVTQSGPFSRFEGIERWFAVLEGDGVALAAGGQVHRLTVDSAPFEFDGELAVDCDLLGGPTRDFNLMTRRGAVRAAVTRASGDCKLHINATEIVAIYSITTRTVARFDSEIFNLEPETLFWRFAAQPGVLSIETGHALLIRMALASAVAKAEVHVSLENP